MSRTAHPYDNAQAERFIKTGKDEAGSLFESQHIAEARGHIGHWIEEVDHKNRLHAARGYHPPVEFAPALAPSCCA
jgi:putative transposase